MDKMREDFEAWWNQRKEVMQSQGVSSLHIRRAHNLSWAAWQASRNSLVVTLPNQQEYDDPLSAFEAIEDCEEAIALEGITVKRSAY